MDWDELHAVLRRLDASDLTAFECEGHGIVLRVRLAHPLPPASGGSSDALTASGVLATAEPEMVLLRSPGMGRFRLSHPMAAVPPVEVGQRILQGDVVGYLQVDELLSPVLADRDARVVRQLAIDGALVGYAQPLFELGALLGGSSA